ncbi:MAG: hypothetical protein WCY74_04935 [Sphaerochaetaceae bacterium]|jgi:hypothetical protein|nr:hypothetical protein [Sphaerochaetaceae bacterium]MDD3942272.1 hypothetical protein [Sphaerochaetaceae bacterium]MDX9939956.1 hypothetical protein [Sphaerochaetaceae bacterium]
MSASQATLLMGILSLPALLLQDNLLGIACQVLYVIFLAIGRGRKFRILPNLILLISVSSAHLLQPNGLHLVSLGGFSVTLGALLLGARKALTLMGLLYLSHFMVSGRPEFPGKLGKLVAMQFYYFEKITTGWRSIQPKRPFIGAIDRLMLLLEDSGSEPASISTKGSLRATTRVLITNAMHVLVLWSLFFAGYLGLLPAFG